MAGICERTPVPTGASSHSPARHAAHDQIATLSHQLWLSHQNDLGTAVTCPRRATTPPASARNNPSGTLRRLAVSMSEACNKAGCLPPRPPAATARHLAQKGQPPEPVTPPRQPSTSPPPRPA